MPHLAPDAAHPVARSSGSIVTSASTADAGATAGNGPTIAASTLAVVVTPRESAAPETSLLRSTGLSLDLEWGQEVALRQLGPDGHRHREVGVALDGPVSFQGVPVVDEHHRLVGLLQICHMLHAKKAARRLGLG